MFVDYVNITVRSGDGGRGKVAFRREKFIPKGTPNGGDGGKGGDIIFTGDLNMNTLLDFTLNRKFIAENGQNGGLNDMSGRSGKSIMIKVPLGTVISDKETGEIYLDIQEENKEYIFLEGGKGGWGNAHFKTATRQAPKYAQPGISGIEKHLNLELKIIADVGLVGYPNAGKSTLLSVMSNARPKIADYPFTTLFPNLGIVKYGNYKSFVMADIPGLIKGASEGKGLGLRFLRHIERTKVLIYMITADSEDYEKDFEVLKNELFAYNDILKEKPFLRIMSKKDLLEKDYNKSYFDHKISSFTQEGLEELKLIIAEKLKEIERPLYIWEK
ncbi:MAG: GTPase ObgE [Candidatus Delongbacteria bacterium]|nr:GTPase ObgE [Candidatus Delongbacteria bacterium]MCG2761127.1 GTPase ObgE [Candidatus Delongbacteria bacterium]